MRNLFRILILISFVMSLSSCELFDPKRWERVDRQMKAAGYMCDGHGNCGYTALTVLIMEENTHVRATLIN